MGTPANNETSGQLVRALTALKEMRARLEQVEQARNEPIAIVGMGCRVPGADNPDEFWRLLRDGVDAVSETRSTRWDADALYDPDPEAVGKLATRWGGFLNDVEGFDAAFFGIAPREAVQMDPQQRLLLEVAWEALEDGGQPAAQLAGTRTGIFVGVHSHSSDYYLLQAGDLGRLDTYSGTGSSHSVLSGRLSYLLDLRGPSLAIDTACSSSLVAVHLAVQSLRSRESDLALAGGVNLMLDPTFSVAASRMHMMAADGRCKPFDARADGFVRGEGCGMVLLKRLGDAQAAGDRILAVIRGSAVNQDGHSNGLTAPNSLSQQAVIEAALAGAGVTPAQIGYVEAHGTGTALGDPIEVEALAAVFGMQNNAQQFCALGSAKANIGHLEGAAGVVGLIKAVLTLRHEQVPPLLHFESLNPHISLAGTPFVIPTEPLAWPAGEQPRHATVSSFGWSGTNAHVVIGEAPAPGTHTTEPRHGHLLPISARSPEALRALATEYHARLRAGEGDVQTLCYNAATRRDHHAYRLAVAAADGAGLAGGLASIANGTAQPGASIGSQLGEEQPGVVFVFPGQGSQWLGMGRELLRDEPVFRAAIEACEQAMTPFVTWSLREQLTAGSARLDEIDVVQPTLFAIQVALAALWRSWGVEPAAVVGHSMGEIAAAYVAGALSLDDAARIICVRSRLLRRVRGHGAMAVVSLSGHDARAAIAGMEDRLSVAVSNSPHSTVLAGDPAALDKMLEQLRAREVFCRLVKVDVASHSPQMDPLLDELATALEGLSPRAAKLPICSSVSGEMLVGEQARATLGVAYWVRNLRQPVRFADAVEHLSGLGYVTFVELSPHPGLLGPVEETLQHHGRAGRALPSLLRESDERLSMLSSLGALYTLGVTPAWRGLYPDGGPAVQLPTYPWQRQRYWLAQPAVRREANPAGANTLLGHRLPAIAPLPGVSLWSGELDPAAVAPTLRRTLSRVGLLSAGVYAGLGLEAAATQDGAALCLRELELHSELILSAAERRATQVAILPGSHGAELHMYSRADAQKPWIEHASAIILSDDPGLPATFDLRAAQAACATIVPSAPGLAEVGLGSREALARLAVEAEQAGPAGYLSAGLRLFELLASNTGAGELSLAGIDRLSNRGGAAPAWAYVRLDESEAGAVAGAVYLLDERGSVVMAASGARFGEPRPELLARLAQARASEWLYQLAWRKLAAAAASNAQRLLLFADGEGLAAEVARLLTERGGEATLVYAGSAFARTGDGSYIIDPANADDVRRLLAELRGGVATVDGAVYLWSIGHAAAELASGAQLLERQRSIAGSALALAQAFVTGDGPRLWLVTRGAVALDQQPVDAEQATLWGLGRVIANEYPEQWGGLIDIEPGANATAAGRLLDALLAGDGEDQLALRGDERLGVRLERTSLEAATHAALRPEASYLITGGLGGVGLALSRWMLANGARYLALLGRRQLDAAGAATIDELERDGARVIYLQADTARSDALAEALARLARELPPLKGVVHAAGVLDDAALLGQTWAGFERVMQAKVAGAWNLHVQTARLELDHFVLCSSASALLGTPGQANYAAANAFLDALAHARHATGLAGLSINWGRWDEVGLAAQAGRDELLGRRGLLAMPPSAGAAAFGALLGHQTPQMTVAAIDWPTLFGQLPRAGATPLLRELGDAGAGAEQQPAAAQPDLLALLDRAPEAARYELCLEYVQGSVATVLRFERPEQVTPDRGFFQLGMDSLTAVELRNLLSRSLGRTLSATLAFDYPTAAGLARHLLAELFPAGAATPAEAPIEDELEAIGQLSRDDINALLDAELDAIDS